MENREYGFQAGRQSNKSGAVCCSMARQRVAREGVVFQARQVMMKGRLKKEALL